MSESVITSVFIKNDIVNIWHRTTYVRDPLREHVSHKIARLDRPQAFAPLTSDPSVWADRAHHGKHVRSTDAHENSESCVQRVATRLGGYAQVRRSPPPQTQRRQRISRAHQLDHLQRVQTCPYPKEATSKTARDRLQVDAQSRRASRSASMLPVTNSKHDWPEEQSHRRTTKCSVLLAREVQNGNRRTRPRVPRRVKHTV